MTEPFGTELLTDPDAILNPDDGPLPPHQATVAGVLIHRYPDLPAHDLIETSATVVYALDKAGLLGTDMLTIEQSTRLGVCDSLGKVPYEESTQLIDTMDQVTMWILTGEKPKPDDDRMSAEDVAHNRNLADLAISEIADMLSGADAATFVSVHTAALRRVLAALREMSAPV